MFASLKSRTPFTIAHSTQTLFLKRRIRARRKDSSHANLMLHQIIFSSRHARIECDAEAEHGVPPRFTNFIAIVDVFLAGVAEAYSKTFRWTQVVPLLRALKLELRVAVFDGHFAYC